MTALLTKKDCCCCYCCCYYYYYYYYYYFVVFFFFFRFLYNQPVFPEIGQLTGFGRFSLTVSK